MNFNSDLQRFDRDGIELIINTRTGESFATVSGYARMSGKAQSTISERIGKHPVETAEIETAGGVQGVRLIPGRLACQWLAKDNPELLAAMNEFGWNGYCHQLAGFKIQSTAIEQLYAVALEILI